MVPLFLASDAGLPHPLPDGQLVPGREAHGGAVPQAARRTDERHPATIRQRAQQEDFGRFPAGALAAEAGPEDATVVHNQQVAGSEPSTDCSEPGLGQRGLPGPRCAPIEDQQPARVAWLGRCLGNRRGWQVIVEVVDAEPRFRVGHAQRLAANTAPGRMARPGAIGQEA